MSVHSGDAVVYADADHIVSEAEGATGGVTLVSADRGSGEYARAHRNYAAARLLDCFGPTLGSPS